MKKKTPAYEQIRLCLDQIRMSAQDVAALDEDIATDIVSHTRAAEEWVNELENAYRKAAKKSSGPKVKSKKRAEQARRNMEKLNAGMTAEERANRARNAVKARWKKAK